MPISDKQRKFIWAGAILFGLYYVTPWAVSTARSAFSHPPPVEAKPTAVHIAPPVPKPVVISPDEAANALAGKMMGDWLGSGVLPERGPCRLTIQIRPDVSKVGGYSAYSTTTCNPTFMTMGQDRKKAMDTLLKAATPTSTIMYGSVQNGDIVFHMGKAIGMPADGCPWTGLTVSHFGELIAAEWQAAPCNGGQMTLHRVTNVQ